MASHENIPYQFTLRKNFKSSLHAFKRLTDTIRDQNRTDPSDGDITKEDVIKYDQFYDAIKTLFGQDVQSKDIAAFFQKITKHPDAPHEWTEIFGCFQTDENIIASQTDAENTVFWLSKRETIGSATGSGKKKRDIIQCVVKVPSLDAVLTVSQKGTISLFNSQDNYVCIRPMKHFLLCVCAVNSQEDSMKDEILVGDDAGYVSLFSIASVELNPPHSKSRVLSQPLVLDSEKFKQFKRKLHNDCVVKVKYIHELNCFASSSLDSKHSLVLDNVQRIKDASPVRSFSVPKGITAFAFCVKANMIITGGPDKIIRLWYPDVTNEAMAELCGHLYSVADIAVNEQDQHVISVSTARGFRVWDIQTLSLLQVFTDTQQGPGDCRINSMVFDNKHLRLLTGSCVLDVWPLTRMIQKTRQVPRSHDRSINALVYNKVFYQVLSICSKSVLKVWEMETGVQVYEIKDAHGPTIEVTTADIDVGGYYFATGANNGSVKIWEFGNGYQVKVLQPKKGCKDKQQGICQLSYKRTHDNQHQHMIIALDISGNIKMIQGKEDDHELFVAAEFGQDAGIRYTTLQSAQEKHMKQTKRTPDSHEDQIMSPIRTTICFDAVKLEKCILIVTGSINGEISLYSLEASSVQHIYSRSSEESANNTNLANNPKTERINVVLVICPIVTEDLNESRSSNIFLDTSKENESNSLQAEMDVLRLGLSFCPEQDIDVFETIKDINLFARKLILKVMYDSSSSSGQSDYDPYGNYSIQDFRNLKMLMQLLQENEDYEKNNSLGSDEDSISACPSPPPPPLDEKSHNITEEGNNMSPLTYQPKSSKFPPLKTNPHVHMFVESITRDLESSFSQASKSKNNFNTKRQQALYNLEQNREITIKSADKGGKIVILDNLQYEEMCMNIIKNRSWYAPINLKSIKKFQGDFEKIIFKAHTDTLINIKTWEFLKIKEPKIPTFYALPKTHKSLSNPPGRPIISGINCHTCNASKLVDDFLRPHVLGLPSYDSIDLLTMIEGMSITPGSFLNVEYLQHSGKTEEGTYQNRPIGKGDLISKEIPFTNQPSVPITALCSDVCANVIISGNEEGYITLWRLYRNQETDRKSSMMLKQELCWRAHSMKITNLFYEDNKNVVVSASEDDSIRLWHASSGNYIGYFGQRRAYKLINPLECTLPCDINELPVETKARKPLLWTTKNFELPLIYNRDKVQTQAMKK
ncbi:WD repeat-containing protein 64 [Mantella aurantiaca]